MASRDGTKQAWRFVGAGFILVAIGMFGLIAGLRFSGSAQEAKASSLHAQIVSNRARIRQLEDDYRRRNIPIPAPTTTSTTAPPRITARRLTTTTSTTAAPTTTTSTTTTSTTTTTTTPCRANVVGICIGGRP